MERRLDFSSPIFWGDVMKSLNFRSAICNMYIYIYTQGINYDSWLENGPCEI